MIETCKNYITWHPATITLLLVNIATLVGFGMFYQPGFSENFTLSANTLSTYPLSFLLYGFMHSGLPHLIVNMFALMMLSSVEEILGSWQFLGLWLLGLVGSATTVVLLSPPEIFTVGASGALFALFGFSAVLAIRLKSGIVTVIVLIAVNSAISLIPGISWQAHLGGLIAGALFGIFYITYKKTYMKQLSVQVEKYKAEKKNKKQNPTPEQEEPATSFSE